MTLDELKVFVTVAKAGGFTKASTVLNPSQPAISRRIDFLEKTLGTSLFERKGRQISLTSAGTSATTCRGRVVGNTGRLQCSCGLFWCSAVVACAAHQQWGWLICCARRFQSC